MNSNLNWFFFCLNLTTVSSIVDLNLLGFRPSFAHFPYILFLFQYQEPDCKFPVFEFKILTIFSLILFLASLYSKLISTMASSKSKERLLFHRLLNISQKNYEEQMKDAVSLFNFFNESLYKVRDLH